MPVDVSVSALEGALADLAVDYPDLELHGVVADFEEHVDDLPSGGRRMVAFLGSTIGNLETGGAPSLPRPGEEGTAPRATRCSSVWIS